MDRRVFQKALTRHFYPRLKAAGFAGTGTTRRRTNAPIVHVVNIQGGQWGGGCYVNLGVHLLRLPTAGDGPPTDSPLEYECMFRKRLGPPPDLGTGMWPYGASESESERTAIQLAEQFANSGDHYLAPYSRWPADFQAVVEEAASAFRPLHGMNMVRLAEHLGLSDCALTIARKALAEAPATATHLRSKLEEFLHARGAV